MPDSLTHFTIARIASLPLRQSQTRLLFYLGAFLPDIVEKSLRHITQSGPYFVIPAHTPLGILLYCYIFCMFFEQGLRPRAFTSLYLGSLLHILCDLFKDHLGTGIPLLFPISSLGYEVGLYNPFNVVYAMPFVMLVLILWELVAKRCRLYSA
jgi:hypothetical protein